jgi:hypothetical protein
LQAFKIPSYEHQIIYPGKYFISKCDRVGFKDSIDDQCRARFSGQFNRAGKSHNPNLNEPTIPLALFRKGGKYQTFITKTEQSDTIILGILAHFRHFRHFSGLSRLGHCDLFEI